MIWWEFLSGKRTQWAMASIAAAWVTASEATKTHVNLDQIQKHLYEISSKCVKLWYACLFIDGGDPKIVVLQNGWFTMDKKWNMDDL